MNKKLKNVIFSILATSVLVSPLMSSKPVNASASMKSVLMYAGKFNKSTLYNKITDKDITNLMSGANQAIVLSAKATTHDSADYAAKLDLIKRIIKKNSWRCIAHSPNCSRKTWNNDLQRYSPDKT